MNITPVQNNNSQSFGMAFKLKGNAAQQLSENFHATSKPEFMENYFIEKIAKPINDLKTLVTYDGEKIVVENSEIGKKLQIRDGFEDLCFPWSPKGSSQINFHVKNGEGLDDVYKINYYTNKDYTSANSSLALESGLDLALLSAKEIAKDFDAQAVKLAQKTYSDVQKQNTINETTSKLQELFG